MSRSIKLFYRLSGIILAIVMLMSMDIRAAAGENTTGSREYLDSLTVGVARILDPSTEARVESSVSENSAQVSAESVTSEESVFSSTVQEEKAEPVEQEQPESNLVMADVQNALNVRAEASEDAEKVGLLYKDCGGKILERRDGWTKLQSGDLVGWANDEYLLFGEDAKEMAGEVGNLIVTIETDALRVRREPNTEAGIYVLMAQDDELDVIEVVDDDWISVAYGNEIGYVSSEFVNLDFHIDEGETVTAIKAREKAEAEAKAKLTTNQGAVVVGADDTRLLAALIYCEAGNQGYEGHLAVGAVVMNRVRSGAYPNSITGVIYASGQFTPALNGKVAKVYGGNIPESCIKAAQEAIGGASNVGTATHFKRAGAHDGIVIGDHVFW
ncbi:cell wall hydrolase [Kineothrix sedimenti]|uniref:Cell wall hydrolase n=1 Tax=Kineothrix sedimenti TaxID=3123317 RepID=A0ABZ3EYF8_9FIRM